MTTLRPAFSATTQRFTTHLAHRFTPSPLRGEGRGEGEFLTQLTRFATSAIAALLLTTPIQAATLTLAPTADAYVQAGTNAKLRVYAKLSASGTVSSSAYAIATTTWGETTLTWNNKPARGAALGNISVTSTGYAWKEIDVTPYVQSEYAANRKVLSFAYNSGTASSLLTTLQSREGTNKPQLVITTNAVPTVSLTAPANGASYTALASVTLTANAADSDGTIANVGFYNGATLINTDTSAPYSYIWTGVASGSYILTAKATDNAGAVTTSSPVNISVTANQAPTVNLQAPTSSDSFTAPATFSIIASATDSDGSIQKVEFYNGAALLGSATQSPYLYDWLNVAAGSYTLTAKAYDNANASTTSAPVNITVNAPQVAAGIYYVYADHLNTARVITDQANKTVWRWDSDPFGTDMAYEDPDGDGIKFGYNLRFPGQYYDRETGLHYNYFRDYDPSTGRYVQSDPIGLEGGINTYSYANQNPLSFTDPTGEYAQCAVWPVGTVACAVAGAGYVYRGYRATQTVASVANAIASSATSTKTENPEQCKQQDPCDELNKAVKAAKQRVGALGACVPGMVETELVLREQAWLALAIARARRDQKCWNGGDDGHQIAQASAWTHVGNCQALLK